MAKTEPAGLLAVDKPEGPTSHDVVAAARRALRTRRVGHTGTLDPFASGLLLLLLGPATRLAEYFDGLEKRYTARMRLGVGTATDDRTGSVIARADTSALDELAIRTALTRQVGDRLQRPPAYSAKKVRGQRAYAAARAGRPLDLQPVPVRIHAIRVTAVELPDVEFEITCGSGTYIRSVARDAGNDLGVPAHLVSLRRTGVGPYDVADAVPLAELDARGAAAVLQPLRALAHLPRAEIDADAAHQVAQGRRVPAPRDCPDGDPVAVAADGALVAVAAVEAGRIVPRKVFARV